MKIAVVGGGERCKRLMEVIESHSFEEIHPGWWRLRISMSRRPDTSRPKSKGFA